MNYVKTEGATHVLVSIKELEKYIVTSHDPFPVSTRNDFYRFPQIEMRNGKVIRTLPKTKISAKQLMRMIRDGSYKL